MKPVVIRSEVIHGSNTLISIEESSPASAKNATKAGSQTNLFGEFKTSQSQSLANTLQGALSLKKKPEEQTRKPDFENRQLANHTYTTQNQSGNISPRNNGTSEEYPLRKLSSTLSA